KDACAESASPSAPITSRKSAILVLLFVAQPLGRVVDEARLRVAAETSAVVGCRDEAVKEQRTLGGLLAVGVGHGTFGVKRRSWPLAFKTCSTFLESRTSA